MYRYKEAGRYASQQDDLHVGSQADVQTVRQIPSQTPNIQGGRRSGRQADTNKNVKNQWTSKGSFGMAV
jgi:hypothetical protein